jgi:hypothetical protein
MIFVIMAFKLFIMTMRLENQTFVREPCLDVSIPKISGLFSSASRKSLLMGVD